MIYETVANETPIKQGDIFRGIPRIDFSLSTIAVIDEDDSHRQMAWRDVLDENGGTATIAAVLPMKSVDAIVITQNCDAARGEYLCLCQIDDFLIATGKENPPSSPKKWARLITEHTRANLRWFYLPADPSMGFDNRKAVDFRIVLRVPRVELETLMDFRVARLNTVGTEHFRETLGQFFRRYPYNEWYPFTREEFEAYAGSSPETPRPYPWQRET